MTEAASPPTEDEVLGALAGVLDPELDESLVELGFVARVGVDGGRVRVELRLPTYWCAPNFSWLMAADVRSALVGRPGVEDVEVVLTDHHAGAEISAGVTEGRGFEETFPAEASGGVEELRALFRRKAFLVRQERLLRSLPGPVADVRLGDLPPSSEARNYMAIREELGLDCSPGAPVVCDAAGRPVADVRAHRRRTGVMEVSMEGNGHFCRSLLSTRYGEDTRG
jgi:metal-sulfur cluster biosynthetic enzyme